jgi:hypothetical protein
MGGIQVEDGDAARPQVLGEQAPLGQEIVLEIPVVIHVVPGEVGEDGAAEARAPHAILAQGMGRDFHREGGAALVRARAQQGEKGVGTGRGQVGRLGHAVDIVADGAQGDDLAARGLEDGGAQGGDGGLAVGAGDRDGLYGFGGTAVPDVEKVAHVGAQIRAGDDLGAGMGLGGAFQGGMGIAFGQDRRGSAGDHVRHIAGTVVMRAFERQEQISLFHLAGIDSDTGDFRIGSRLQGQAGIAHEQGQLHISPSIPG